MMLPGGINNGRNPGNIDRDRARNSMHQGEANFIPGIGHGETSSAARQTSQPRTAAADHLAPGPDASLYSMNGTNPYAPPYQPGHVQEGPPMMQPGMQPGVRQPPGFGYSSGYSRNTPYDHYSNPQPSNSFYPQESQAPGSQVYGGPTGYGLPLAYAPLNVAGSSAGPFGPPTTYRSQAAHGSIPYLTQIQYRQPTTYEPQLAYGDPAAYGQPTAYGPQMPTGPLAITTQPGSRSPPPRTPWPGLRQEPPVLPANRSMQGRNSILHGRGNALGQHTWRSGRNVSLNDSANLQRDPQVESDAQLARLLQDRLNSSLENPLPDLRPLSANQTAQWRTAQRQGRQADHPSNSYRISEAVGSKSEPSPVPDAPPRSQVASEQSVGEVVLRDFGRILTETKCVSCQSRLLPEPGDLIAHGRLLASEINSDHANSISPYAKSDGPHYNYTFINCQLCGDEVCAGCGKRPARPASTKGKSTADSNILQSRKKWCCDRGRLYVVWLLLCGPEWRPISPSIDKRSRGSNPSPTPPRPVQEAESPLSRPSKGTAYDDPENRFQSFIPLHAARQSLAAPGEWTAPDSDDDEADAQMKSYFEALANVMPEQIHAEKLASDASQFMQFMLQRSPMMTTAESMLKSRPFGDILSHHVVHEALFTFLELLASHRKVSQSFHGLRLAFPLHQSLMHATMPQALPTKVDDFESGQSLSTLLHKFGKPARRFLEYASADAKHQLVEFGDGAVELCDHICRLEKYRPVDEAPTSQVVVVVGTRMSDSQKQAELAAWHAENAVDDIDDGTISPTYVFAKEMRQMSGVRQGWINKIVKEVASLCTSLPNGIYVRHGSGRWDMLKVLIVGPKDTPYENGLFEFDLMCPAEYPTVPPKMRFKTTGHGKVDFNLNLYANGKVCLSLLGTWQGEQWRPGVSTILQLLVSIQSMIFCEEPWLNEPARHDSSGTFASAQYNQRIRIFTTAYAIRDWAVKPGPIWGEVVKRHFRANASTILKTQRIWLAEHCPMLTEDSVFMPEVRPICDLEQVTEALAPYQTRG